MSTISLLTMTNFPDFPEQLSGGSVLSLFNLTGNDIPVKNSTLESYIDLVEKEESVSFHFIELVYVDEDRIVTINKEYLDRDYVTDIITFSYEETTENGIEGTLYCCAPRIEEQSRELKVDTEQEFYRIFIHGLLHLAGYNDSTSKEKETMTRLENHYLQQLSS